MSDGRLEEITAGSEHPAERITHETA
jgi:hypothetical protein